MYIYIYHISYHIYFPSCPTSSAIFSRFAWRPLHFHPAIGGACWQSSQACASVVMIPTRLGFLAKFPQIGWKRSWKITDKNQFYDDINQFNHGLFLYINQLPSKHTKNQGLIHRLIHRFPLEINVGKAIINHPYSDGGSYCFTNKKGPCSHSQLTILVGFYRFPYDGST